MTRLTLTLPDDLARQADAYARETGRSLESIVEVFLENMVKARNEPPALSPQVQKLYGAVKLPPDFDYQQAVTDALSEKYRL